MPKHDLSAAHSRVLTARLTETQYHHLVVQATKRDVTISEALRSALERDIDAQPGIKEQGDEGPGFAMGYRQFLGLADFGAAVQELGTDDAEA